MLMGLHLLGMSSENIVTCSSFTLAQKNIPKFT